MNSNFSSLNCAGFQFILKTDMAFIKQYQNTDSVSSDIANLITFPKETKKENKNKANKSEGRRAQ